MHSTLPDSGIRSSGNAGYCMDSLRFLVKNDLRVYTCMGLENYLHLVVQSNNLNRDVARFKSYIARQLIQYLTNNNAKQILQQLAFYKKAHKDGRAYQFWQAGCHPGWIPK